MQKYPGYKLVEMRKVKHLERLIRNWNKNFKRRLKSLKLQKRNSMLMIRLQRELLQFCKKKWLLELIRLVAKRNGYVMTIYIYIMRGKNDATTYPDKPVS